MSKEFKKYLPIWLILIILTNLIFWIIDLDKSKEFYISILMVNIAFLFQLGISFYALNKKKTLTARIMIKSLVVLLVLILINTYVVYHGFIDPVLGQIYPEIHLLGALLRKADIPKVILTVDIILLAVDFIAVILLGQHSNRIEERDRYAREKTEVMRNLTAKAKYLAESMGDPQVHKVYEELRYSKSVLSDENLAVASTISDLLSSIENETDDEVLKSKCAEIGKLIKRLNSI